MRTNFSTRAMTLIVAALWFATPQMCAGQSGSTAGKAPPVLPAVATLSVHRSDGKTAIGTAFLGVRDGQLVTTLNVLKDATKVTATFPDGEEFDCVGIVDRDVRHNLALVRVREFGRPRLTISPTGMKVGDKASVAIIKNGAFGVVGVTVADVVVEGGLKFYHLTGQIPDGNNGSPVVNAAGDVVGVHVSIIQGGREIDMALPSAYILGLEPSLPVQRWAAVASAGASRAAQRSAAAMPANTALDTMLAVTMTRVHDLWAQYTPLSQTIYDWTRYANSKNLDLYTVQSRIDSWIEQLGWLKPTDPLRAKLVQAAGQLLANERQAIGLDIQCWLLNKDASPDQHILKAENAARQATAMFEVLPSQITALQPGFRQLAESSPVFLAALSRPMRYALGVTPRKSKLVLGAYILSDAPMEIFGVRDHGLADKLKLEAGDVIMSAGGQDFKPTDDIEDFMLLIESHAGGRLEVVVKRRGKLKTLHMKIPADVVQTYGGA